MTDRDDRVVRSPRLPGGDLVAAVLDRRVMALADRGGGSNLVGGRWADLCAEHAGRWPGMARPVPDGSAPLFVTDVHRLDARPAVAAAASRRGLQNPDLLLVGTIDGEPAVQAADAKFSVETARAKQVSPDVVAGLLGLRQAIPGLFPELPASPRLVPGVFLSPDYPLTDLMLQRRYGILRTTVRAAEVVLLPAPAAPFFASLEGSALIPLLASVDDLPIDHAASLLASLYYFRLARAAVGIWLDATRPLLALNDRLPVDEEAIATEAQSRTAKARSAIDLVLRWDADVQVVRDARAAIDQVAALPLTSRDLRELLAQAAQSAGPAPLPSVNVVRRRLGAWFRHELRERVGPLSPPVADLPGALDRVAKAGAEIAPSVPAEAERIVRELIAGGDARQQPQPAQLDVAPEVDGAGNAVAPS